MNHIKKLQKMCGTYAIARMLQRAGVPFYMARWILIEVK